MTDKERYLSPLSVRYASQEMSHLFSPQYKCTLWRRLWTELARAQHALGLPITGEQVAALEQEQRRIDFERVAEHERLHRHDVMAHIHAYGDAAPIARGIIHLGATSSFVTDNADIFQMREALQLLQGKTLQLIEILSGFAHEHASLPCLSFTHFQPAQPTTVGKRAALWLQDFLFDFQDITAAIASLYFPGVRGATGTQASFLALFEGESAKVDALEQKVAEAMGFTRCLPLSSQTYPRKLDMRLFAPLAGLAASASKTANDLRLLAHLKEIREPFGRAQTGSSAMPHKRNPMRSERICSLARFLLSLSENPGYTAATQWLERSLDDSANRRLVLPEGFLTADALLNLLIDTFSGLTLSPGQIARNLESELPFLLLEEILMAAVKRGGDRQSLHARLRSYALEAQEVGSAQHLLDQIAADPLFSTDAEELQQLLCKERLTGRAEEQVMHFLSKEVSPLLKNHHALLPSTHPSVEL